MIDRAACAARFAADGRVQVRDVLTRETAEEIRHILAEKTRWGLAWQSGIEASPQAAEAAELAGADGQDIARTVAQETSRSAGNGGYAFRFARYPMVQAYLGQWDAGGPHDLLLEYINTPDMLDLVREITGFPDLVKGDAQATLFAQGHFLGKHIDSHVEEGWRVAYVLNFAPDDWSPDWGGYLNFLDDDGDIIAGYRPRFNTLNMFRVPQAHNVSFVPPFAPAARFAITGWFRDR
ncbi:MAG: 2OG-Fe(II) oxygenase [Sphingomonadaceae bacterium]